MKYIWILIFNIFLWYPFLLSFFVSLHLNTIPQVPSVFFIKVSPSMEEFCFDGRPRYNLTGAAGPSLCGPSDGR